MVFDIQGVSSTSRIAYVTITIINKDAFFNSAPVT